MVKSNIGELMQALHSEVLRVRDESEEIADSVSLQTILIDSIHKTMKEISLGADPTEFRDLTVLNFVLTADDLGHPVADIRTFVRTLSKPEE